jgi:hypothetical protein
MAEMKQSYHGGYPQFQEPVDHSGILVKYRLVKTARLWFESRPLNRKTVTVNTQAFEKIKVLPPSRPVVNRPTYSRIKTTGAKPALRLPSGDVILDATLYLKC